MPTAILTATFSATLAGALLAALPGPVSGSLAQNSERWTWERLTRRLDPDGDGRITKEEFQERFSSSRRKGQRLFTALDDDGDGVLTAADFGQGPVPEQPAGAGAQTTLTSEQRAASEALFEEEVLPILELNCLDCHSEGGRQRADLALDSLAALARGGISGPAVAPGQPGDSLLMEVVSYADESFAMPPDGPLDPEDVEILRRWIESGAAWPGQEWPNQGNTEVAAEASEIDWEAGREWWSFQPVEGPPTPAFEGRSADWILDPVDAFVLEKLEEAELRPVEEAERGAWLRRVSFDLIGLPPTPEELEAFISDRDPDAYERVVDRLLASPHYAERWGRHWLDVARYAESSGKDTNVLYPHAWRYRDWVIDAFERDLPYDEFLKQQLAGDLLPAESNHEEALQDIATGFLALGPKSHRTRNPLQFRADVVDEQIDAVSQGMLGLTVSCARCHDHKFDPISTRDYYSLAGIFSSTRTLFGTIASTGNRRATPLIELPAEAELPNGPSMSADLRRFLARTQGKLEERMEGEMKLPAMMGADPEKRRESIVRQVINRGITQNLESVLERFGEDGDALPANRLAMGVEEGRLREAQLLLRGEIDAPQGKVPRGFPTVFQSETTPPISRRSSGRLELAEWIASEEHPLTARVWVNRVWSYLFGQGLVASNDNFGHSGQLPTHPELLDHLAASFVEQGWSTKELVRRLVLSRTYRLSAEPSAKAEKVDPEGRLLWRMPPRRLEAEALRDALLYSAGTLQTERPVGSPVGVWEGSTRSDRIVKIMLEDQPVRSVYLPVLRDRVAPDLECFDAADPSFVTGVREETISATQALFLMNDETVLEAADAFAESLLSEYSKEEERIEQAFLRVLSRAPSSAERRLVERFLKDYPAPEVEPSRRKRRAAARERREQEARAQAEQQAWSAFLQSLYQSAEFRYRG